MSQQQDQPRPKVLKFLNDYRKTLSLLKIRSFYANHLCKKNCYQGKLGNNNDTCIQGCDEWLGKYFTLKNEKNPDKDELVLLSSSQIPQAQRGQYEKQVARMRIGVNSYINQLQTFINDKIKIQTKK